MTDKFPRSRFWNDYEINKAHEDALSLNAAYDGLDDKVGSNYENYYRSNATISHLADCAVRGLIGPVKETQIIDSNYGVDNYFSQEIVKYTEAAKDRAKIAVGVIAGQYKSNAEGQLKSADRAGPK